MDTFTYTRKNSDIKSATAWLGIDVSKLTLDVKLVLANDKHFSGRFANDKKGFQQLFKWSTRIAPDQSIHFCMEATGGYSFALAMFLAQNQQLVSVVNPFKIKHYGLSEGIANKTDKADAALITSYCRKSSPSLWRMTAPEVRTLVALVRHLDSLQQTLVQQKNRLSDPDLVPLVERSLRKLLKQLEQEIDQIEKQIDKHIDQHPGLKSDRDLLLSIPGIASKTAARILAELPDVQEFSSAQDAAAYAGLNPRQYRSGTSVYKPTRLSKRGNARLRAALYLPALTAMTYNPSIKAFADRLRPRFNKTKPVIAAAMRKLLMLAFGVLKNKRKFDPNYVPA